MALRGLDGWLRRRRAPADHPADGPVVDPAMLCVPIERPGGSVVSDFKAAAPWAELAAGATPGAHGVSPIRIDELAGEAHHGVYAQPWIAGRFRFDFLAQSGLSPRERVLDIGCGSGRLGIWVVRYLEGGCYFGIDGHLRSLVAFSAYELRLHGLATKRPRLLHDPDFHFEHFGQRFDAALDVCVSRFLSAARFHQAFSRLRAVLVPGATVFAAHPAAGRREIMQALGFELVRATEVEWPLFSTQGSRSSGDRWHIYRLGAGGQRLGA